MVKQSVPEEWTPAALHQWQTLVRERSGLFFDQNRISRLREGVEDRMLVCAIGERQVYWQLVQESDQEFAALLTLLTVNESYFFRGMEELRLFCDALLPSYQQKQRLNRPVSVVSAGCASGEEAYSIAILLLESHGDKYPFQVRGGDVDGRALQVARDGLYGESAFRGCDGGLRQRYFARDGSGRERIVAQLQDKVAFFPLNLMSEIYPEPLRGVDFIFYRNVSIYFDAQSKRAIFCRLLEQLAPHGCLFLSPAEIFFHNQPQIRPNDVHLDAWQGRFFFRKLARRVAPVLTWPGEERREREEGAREPIAQPATAMRARAAEVAQDLLLAGEKLSNKMDRQRQMAKVVRLALADEVEQALQHVAKRLWSDPPHPQVATLKAAVLLCDWQDRSALREAIALCRAVIKRDALCFEGLVLLAMGLHQEGGDAIERIAHLRAAVFLNPASWLPHYYLAQAYESLQELGMAAREYQVVIYRLTQAGGIHGHGLPLLPLPFAEQALIQYCQNRLQQMNPA
ncbi:MAG: protein-glutamate O-methyltransferase CheR [Magnetococcales bacterium]|nr:protein-glutamate O-methyltransferase CheR [Magnetococcales bacterium]MBF0114924.1 protein-glutamate O-methyltransferase CheR [Magnetococcales bacterium]